MNYFGEIRKPCKYSLDWFEKNYFVDFTRNILVYKSGGSIVRRLIILSLCLFEENPDFNHTIFDFKRYCYQKPSKQQWLDYCLSQKEFRDLPLTEIHQLWLKSNYLDFLTFISSESHAEYLEACLDEIKALNQQEKDYLLFFFYKNIDYILDKTHPNPKKAKKEKIFEPDIPDDEIYPFNFIRQEREVETANLIRQRLTLLREMNKNKDDIVEKEDNVPTNIIPSELFEDDNVDCDDLDIPSHCSNDTNLDGDGLDAFDLQDHDLDELDFYDLDEPDFDDYTENDNTHSTEGIKYDKKI